MSIGDGIGQGLMFLANNIAQNRRMGRQAEIESQQMEKRMQMQQQFAEQERLRALEAAGQENQAANQALLGLTGEQLPEGYDQSQLKMVSPGMFEKVLGKKEQAEQKKLQAKIRTQFAAQYDKATPEEQNALLAEAENNGVDLLPFLQYQQGRSDKKSSAEERKAEKIADREDRQAFQAQQNSMYKRLAGEIGRAARSGGGRGGGSKDYGTGLFKDEYGDTQKYYLDKQGRPAKKYLEPVKPGAAQPSSKSNLYAPVQVNVTPRR